MTFKNGGVGTVGPRKQINNDDVDDGEWMSQGNCSGFMDDSLFPVERKDEKNAARICRGCPVALQCLDAALRRREEWGVWGGMTSRQRGDLLRA